MIAVTEHDGSIDAEWDNFVRQSTVDNFLHTRKFLSYHGGRFVDKSVCARDEKGRLVAVFNAAEQPANKNYLMSHPGATYGGVICNEKCQGEQCVEVLSAIVRHYASQGYTKLVYKVVPFIYHQMLAQDDLYALFRLGARRAQSELSACIDLSRRGKISTRRKRALKKALAASVKIERGSHFIGSLWTILEENLKRKHDASPVHTVDEITTLYEMFPDEIDFVVATLNGEVVSGVVLFYSANAVHAQYIASSEKGYSLSALDAVFNFCINECKASGKRYFDFGTSNDAAGRILNSGLYAFKSEFGAGGVVYDRYEIELGNV